MKKRKDILFLCQYFYPEYISSATLPFDTAVRLAKEGLSVGAVCGYPKEYNITRQIPMEETHEKVEIKRLKYIQLNRANFLGRLINYFSFTISVALNFVILSRYKTIIVYSNPPVLPLIAVLANKFFKTKVVFISYDIYPEIAFRTNAISKNGLISKVMGFVNKVVFSRVNKVVALSNEMKDYLLKYRHGIDENQVNVIPNWYEDNARIRTGNPSQNILFKSFNDKFIVSYFGNLGTAQDLDTILSAIKKLKGNSSLHFMFAVHGNKVKLLKEFVNKEKIENVTIFDFLHGKDFQDALTISSCFLVSLAEGLSGLAVPSKTYSYMMAGKPILAIMDSHSDIARDLLVYNAGYAMEIGESSKLVNAIKELQNNKEIVKIMGDNCRKVFLDKYTKEHCTEKYVTLMKEILED